jgi:hypothetical protein
MAPELFMIRPPLINRGRAGMPGARRTRSLAWKIENTRVSHHGRTGITPAFPHANGFNGFLRDLPGDRLYCHRHLLIIVS